MRLVIKVIAKSSISRMNKSSAINKTPETAREHLIKIK